jgi:hypothetical protein
MSDTSRVSKLAELRSKTDRQLAGLIDNALERGFRLSGLASERAGAERTYAEISTLLTKVEDPAERWRLENKLQRLRAALNDLRPAERPAVKAAGFAQTVC